MNIDKNTQSRKSFTLAEMLITLIVVSVVAIMTLPALMYKIDDFRWNAARQKMVYNIREAGRRMAFANAGGIGGFGTAANFRDQLAKYLSAAKSCDTVTDCFPATIKDIAGNVATIPASGTDLGITFASTPTPGAAVGLILNNGASLNIIYNSDCTEYDPVNDTYGADLVCANIVFDINGFAPPNRTGKDIGFISIIDPKTTIVAGASPDIADYKEGATTEWDWWDAIEKCKAKGTDWHLPNKDELNSIFYNRKIIGNINESWWHWSSSEYAQNTGKAWYQHAIWPLGVDFKGNAQRVRCVRR